jgi:hypothetical protein
MPPQRRHTSKGIIEDDRTPTLVFLNVCTANREAWLADPHLHATLVKVWKSATHWEVGPYVLMPDHLHLFAWPGFGSATFDPLGSVLEIDVYKNASQPQSTLAIRLLPSSHTFLGRSGTETAVHEDESGACWVSCQPGGLAVSGGNFPALRVVVNGPVRWHASHGSAAYSVSEQFTVGLTGSVASTFSRSGASPYLCIIAEDPAINLDSSGASPHQRRGSPTQNFLERRLKLADGWRSLFLI